MKAAKNSNRNQWHRALAAASLAGVLLALSGCATTAPDGQADTAQPAPAGSKAGNVDPELARRLHEADARAQQAIAAGQDAHWVVAPYRQLGNAYPRSPEPWAHMAQRYFDARRYGDAITAASEAQKRDPTHQVALGVMAVSGLRAATDALSALKDKGNLGNTLSRADADRVVRLLRGATGERVLVPRPQDDADTAPRVQPARKPVRRAAASRTAARPAAKPATPTGGNPFLKLN